MIRLILIVFILSSYNLTGQVIIVKDFSDRFYAKLQLEEGQSEEVFKKGTVSIITTNNNVELFSVKSESITIEIDKDAQKIEIPFTKQDVVLYQDFNFDGQNDLGIQEFYSSKGPGYLVYLNKDDKFILDSEYTEIIQNSQGNYELDSSSKTITTMCSGGCCWHKFSSFTVESGRPSPTSEVIEELDLPFNITTTKKWDNGKAIETVERMVNLNQDGIIEIMSFKLLNKNKRVVLYNINDRTLNYVLIDGEDISEFFYPIKTVYKNRDFVVSNSGNELIFKNKDVQYKIYQTVKTGSITGLGVLVTVKGKEYDLKGDVKTLKGDINKNAIVKLDNVFNE